MKNIRRFFIITLFLASSSHETFVEENVLVRGGGYRRISPMQMAHAGLEVNPFIVEALLSGENSMINLKY